MQMQAENVRLFRAAGWSASISAVVSAFGVLFLVLLYIGFLPGLESLQVFGPINDVCVLIQYALAVPVVMALYRILRDRSPLLCLLASVIGIVGIVGVVVFQLFLLTGVMTFSEQVGYASTSILLIGVWIVIAGMIGRKSGVLPYSLPLLILAFFYFGFPIWAYRTGKQLLSRAPGMLE
jgi:hypothetical protein